MQFLVPLICLLAGGVLGYLSVRHRAFGLYVVIALGLVAGILWCIVEAESHTGWDALAYGIMVMLFLAPALLGQLIGGGIGLYRGRKSGQRSGP